jgi:hypothetical protein
MRDERVAVPASWLLTLVALVVAVESLVELDLVVGLYAGSVAAVAVLPVVDARLVSAVAPWEALAVAALPVIGWALDVGVLQSRPAIHLAVAGFAILMATELQIYTTVRMSDGFATAFVVIATLANAGVWAVLQWFADFLFATRFLGSHDDVMWGFVAAGVAGAVGGLLFTAYFRYLMDVGYRERRRDGRRST